MPEKIPSLIVRLTREKEGRKEERRRRGYPPRPGENSGNFEKFRVFELDMKIFYQNMDVSCSNPEFELIWTFLKAFFEFSKIFNITLETLQVCQFVEV